MSKQKANGKSTEGGKFTKGINIPPQPTIPKMPPTQPPKKSN
jgi:hypothetical protein